MGKYMNIFTNRAESERFAKQKFEQYDVDKSGYIEYGEFRQAVQDFLTLRGVDVSKIPAQDYEDGMKEYDTNNDQRLSAEEFSKFIDFMLEGLALKEEREEGSA